MRSRVQLVSVSRGAEFEIDLAAFPEPDPVFAYVDGAGRGVEALSGLAVDGPVAIEGRPPAAWRRAGGPGLLLKADTTGGRRVASLRSRAVGEFRVEVYHVRPDGAAELLYRGDFCFK